jgi:hypothetical protein
VNKLNIIGIREAAERFRVGATVKSARQRPLNFSDKGITRTSSVATSDALTMPAARAEWLVVRVAATVAEADWTTLGSGLTLVLCEHSARWIRRIFCRLLLRTFRFLILHEASCVGLHESEAGPTQWAKSEGCRSTGRRGSTASDRPAGQACREATWHERAEPQADKRSDCAGSRSGAT